MSALQGLAAGLFSIALTAAAPPVEAPRPKASPPREPVVAAKPRPAAEHAEPNLVARPNTNPPSVDPTSIPTRLRPLPANAIPRPARPIMPRSWTPGGTLPVAAAAPARPRDPLDALVDEAIETTSRRVLAVETHTPWQIAHGMLAYRRSYVVRKDGEKIDAYAWVASNPVFNGRPWFHPTRFGARPQKFTQPYEFEGHPNQFLAFFAMARLPLDFPFRVGDRMVTYAEMLRNAKMEANDREEITWTLWAFAYYFDWNDRWVSADGQQWSMERLIQTQLNAPVEKSACGGCHGLFALASARNAYLQAGNKLGGVWMQTHMHLQKYIQMARSLQNADGTFSSSYFKGPDQGRRRIPDASKRISTTGHTLEFLMMAMPQNQLREQWVRNAVAALSRDLIANKSAPLEVGGMYHAAHALVLYRERTRPDILASRSNVLPVAGQTTSAKPVAPAVPAEPPRTLAPTTRPDGKPLREADIREADAGKAGAPAAERR